jgi:O-methyltransferase
MPWNKEINDPDTVAIRKLNEKIANDSRVDISMIPMADGITLCRVL